MDVRPTTPEQTRPLRAEILRPGQDPETLALYGDDFPGSFHAGAFEDGALVCTATVYPEPMPVAPEADPGSGPGQAVDVTNAFRLRGMATKQHLQGRGYGRAVLERCIEHVRASGAEVLWCNARTGALGFYQRLGFETVGDEFEIEGIGPHYVMWKPVR